MTTIIKGVLRVPAGCDGGGGGRREQSTKGVLRVPAGCRHCTKCHQMSLYRIIQRTFKHVSQALHLVAAPQPRRMRRHVHPFFAGGSTLERHAISRHPFRHTERAGRRVSYFLHNSMFSCISFLFEMYEFDNNDNPLLETS